MTLGELLLSILPLVLIAPISPALFVQSSTIVMEQGPKAIGQFLAGNIVVLLVLGPASIGLLGVSVTDWADRELRSDRVGIVLALLLVAYGTYVLVNMIRHRHGFVAKLGPRHALPDHGLFAYGALNAATDFTGLPIYIAINQQIGIAQVDFNVKTLLFVVASAFFLMPIWLPWALYRRMSNFKGVVDKISRQLSAITQWSTLIGCFGGALILFWNSMK